MQQFPADIDLSTLDGTNGFKISREAAGDKSGRVVASAGDVNGDGFADVIVGAYMADPNGRTNAGAAYVVFGHGGAFPELLHHQRPLLDVCSSVPKGAQQSRAKVAHGLLALGGPHLATPTGSPRWSGTNQQTQLQSRNSPLRRRS